MRGSGGFGRGIYLTLLKGSMYFSAGGGGGVIVSDGGVQPYLRQMAWTSDPEDHLKSLFATEG